MVQEILFSSRWFKKFYLVPRTLMIRQGQVGKKLLILGLPSGSKKKTQHLTVQWDLSYSEIWQKYLKLLNCASYYQNIAKFLTHSNTFCNSYTFMAQHWKLVPLCIRLSNLLIVFRRDNNLHSAILRNKNKKIHDSKKK